MLGKIIINYITTVISIFTQAFCLSKIINNNCLKSLKERILCNFFIAFLPLISLMSKNIFITGLISLFSYVLIEKFNIKKEYHNSQFLIFLWAFNIVLEIIISLPLGVISIYTANELKNNTLLTFLMSMILNFILFTIFSINNFRKLLLNVKYYSKFDKKTSNILLIMLFESFMIGAIIGSSYINYIAKAIFLIMLLLSDLMFLFFSKHLKQENKLSHINDNLLKENMNINDELINYKEFKHNMIHALNGVKVISDKKTSTLINNIIDKEYKGKRVMRINIEPTQIEKFIYNYLFEYIDYLNIHINNYFDQHDEYIENDEYTEFCKNIGIALDNAKEASIMSKEKLIIINLSNEKDLINIEIINTFNAAINIDMIGKSCYTTKKYHLGVGLKSVTKNKYITNKIKIVNNLFIHKIALNTAK